MVAVVVAVVVVVGVAVGVAVGVGVAVVVAVGVAVGVAVVVVVGVAVVVVVGVAVGVAVAVAVGVAVGLKNGSIRWQTTSSSGNASLWRSTTASSRRSGTIVPNTSKHRNDVSHARLLEILRYEPLTGKFFWIVTGRGRVRGAEAGTPHNAGYTIIGIDGFSYLRHRLAWLYVHGRWPVGKLDHRDRIPGHDWIANLREATSPQNAINSQLRPRKLPRGVYLHHGAFVAQTTRRDLEKKTVTIGRFATPEAAHIAWLEYMIAHHGQEFLPT